ncbi:MAG TPA: hypothetical protein VN717_09325 [Gemmatimonadaceae bacterium]|nr:hypothetical protein [Gemmatimonadaceae bacterium]
MIGLAIVGFIYGDFAQIWRFAPAWMPAHRVLAYASAALMLVCGIGLLSKRTEALATRVLFPYWAFVVFLLKLPLIVEHPVVEMTYLTMGTIVVVLTGAWVLFAATGRAVRIAQLVFGAALIPIGLSHFVYMNLTAPLVPAWLPFHTGWGYLTGAAHLAAGFGVLLGIYPRLAAAMEAAMLSAFTALVWIPLIVATPSAERMWSEFTISWAVSAGAWVVAASFMSEKARTAT